MESFLSFWDLSLFNVKQHADIRDILLKKTLLDIQRLGRAFDGVFTEVIRISLRKYHLSERTLSVSLVIAEYFRSDRADKLRI